MRASWASLLIAFLAFGHVPAIAQTDDPDESYLSGTLSVAWIDGVDGPQTQIDVHTSSGIVTVDPWSPALQDLSLAAVDGRRVELSGTLDGALMRADSLVAAQATPPPIEASGSERWITLLCRFADATDETPFPTSWFEGLMSSRSPGVDNWFRQVSYGKVDLAGSEVVGWLNLPNPEAAYRIPTPYSEQRVLNDRAILQDCVDAADAKVDFSTAYGINVMVNRPDTQAIERSTSIVTDDGRISTRSVLLTPARHGYLNQAVVVHEMLHGNYLFHSSGPYDFTYDSAWDPMSAADVCERPHPVYGCVAVHVPAQRKSSAPLSLHWIPAEREVTVAAGGASQSIDVDALWPAEGTDALLVRVPAGVFEEYSIEVRSRVGYDRGIPAAGVVIHFYDPFAASPAGGGGNTPTLRVVDSDRNGNPNDAGAVWLPGETFTDPDRGVTIHVDAMTSTGYTVTVTNQPAGPPPVYVRIPTSRAESLAAGVPDRFTFPGLHTSHVRIRTSGLDTMVELHDQYGGVVASNDNGPSAHDGGSELDVLLPLSGRYMLTVTGKGGAVGDYQLTFEDLGRTYRIIPPDYPWLPRGASTQPALSATGTIVAFPSTANNFVDAAAAPGTDVIMADVYHAFEVANLGSDGMRHDAVAARPAMSRDGLIVAFVSKAPGLVRGDTNRSADIFVHDRVTGSTERVSFGDRGQANRDSSQPSISADGRYIAFVSAADNLVAGDTNHRPDIFVHDRTTHTTRLVSFGQNGKPANEASAAAAISGDGRFVAFQSNATNLVRGDRNRSTDVFVADLELGTMTAASVIRGQRGTKLHSTQPAISGDGSRVVFTSLNPRLVRSDRNQASDIVLYDRTTGKRQTVSVSDTERQANGASSDPAITADGRYVAFQTAATNLAGQDRNRALDVYVRDLVDGGTILVSGARDTMANADGVHPAIAVRGFNEVVVVFETVATNLGHTDHNRARDIYLRVLRLP